MVELSDNSVHVCVTSPPYWGLRKYKIQDLVWGKHDCEHEWGQELPEHHPGQVEDNKWLNADGAGHGQTAKSGQFCLKCNAWKGQLGLEPSPELFVSHIVEVFREVKRVLRPDGILWLNCGDSYTSGKGTCYNPGGGKNSLEGHAYLRDAEAYPLDRGNKSTLEKSGLKPLDLCQMPFHVAHALQQDGWWLRSTIVWQKNNPMPESVSATRWEKHKVKVKSRDIRKQQAGIEATEQLGNSWPDNKGGVFQQMAEWQDCPGCPKCTPNEGLVLRKGSWRPTEAHEYIFMLTKTGEYFANQEAVREKANPEIQRGKGVNAGIADGNVFNGDRRQNYEKDRHTVSSRNCRTVWSFPTAPYKGAHFATFPEELVKQCLKASTSEASVCAECGTPWAPIIEAKKSKRHESELQTIGSGRGETADRGKHSIPTETQTLGYRPCCQCKDAKTIPALVLDPFCGSGTVMLVASKMGLRSVGYELSEEYCKLAVERNKQMALGQIRGFIDAI